MEVTTHCIKKRFCKAGFLCGTGEPGTVELRSNDISPVDLWQTITEAKWMLSVDMTSLRRMKSQCQGVMH